MGGSKFTSKKTNTENLITTIVGEFAVDQMISVQSQIKKIILQST
jgi:hypothetical protein